MSLLPDCQFHMHTSGSGAVPSLPIPFYFVLVSVAVFIALSPYFIPQMFPTTLRFLTLVFRSYFFLIDPLNYMSLYQSLPQP